jgi:hypothetical protein
MVSENESSHHDALSKMSCAKIFLWIQISAGDCRSGPQILDLIGGIMQNEVAHWSELRVS